MSEPKKLDIDAAIRGLHDLREYEEAQQIADLVVEIMANAVGKTPDEVEDMTLGEWQEKVRQMQ